MAKKTPKVDDLDADSSPDEVLILSPETDEIETVDDEIAQDIPSDPTKPARKAGLSVLLGIVLGGVIAAGIGFYAARYIVPEGWPLPGVAPEPDPIALEQVKHGERLAGLEAQIETQAQAIAALASDDALSELATKLEMSQGELASAIAALTAVDARLSEVEKIPQGSGTEAAEAAAAAYERELAAMRDMLAGELTRIEAAGAAALAGGQNAEEVARQAEISAALAQVRTALEDGQPFDSALDALGVDVPATLTTAAAEGVATLATLREDFPDAARAALDASIAAQIEDGSIGRVAGFMQRQLGTRSLEPQEGDDPDAVLSRAEAALKQGQIADALGEISTLPEVGQSEMATWVEAAGSRLDVLNAADDLTALVNGE